MLLTHVTLLRYNSDITFAASAYARKVYAGSVLLFLVACAGLIHIVFSLAARQAHNNQHDLLNKDPLQMGDMTYH
jgi:hypothetical protein